MFPESARQFILWAGEAADGYLRDGCVFREDINIPDTSEKIEVPPSRLRPAP